MAGEPSELIEGLSSAYKQIADLKVINADLLEALKGCLPTLEGRERMVGAPSRPLLAARAAIAKATGGSND